MKVLIIATNRELYPYAVPPLGASIVTSALRRAGHQATLLDLCNQGRPLRAALEALRRHRPHVIGLSIRNLDSCSYHYPQLFVAPVRELVTRMREVTDAPIVTGGSAVTIGGAALLEYLGLTYGVVGEGEAIAPKRIEALGAGRTPECIPGLIAARSDRRSSATCPPTTSQAAPAPGSALDDPAINDFSPVAIKPYLRKGGLIGLQTKRGCRYNCLYCNYPAIEGHRYRLRAPTRCVEDMERAVAEQGVRDFFFADSVFNQPADHALAICEEIIRRGLRLRWMAYCNPHELDREMARIFTAAGCVGLELGLDAATDKMLVKLRKRFTQADIARASKALHDAGLPFAHFLLFGGPGERWRDVDEARRFLESLPKANAVLVSLGLRIYPGTAIQQIAIEEGLIAPDASLLEPTYYIAPTLGAAPKAQLDAVAERSTTWMTPTDWELPMVKLVHGITGRLRLLPPWKGFEEYGKHMRPKARWRRDR
jgi:radical SAM superfamily enzyme YgiQ (UPF0313 family)